MLKVGLTFRKIENYVAIDYSSGEWLRLIVAAAKATEP